MRNCNLFRLFLVIISLTFYTFSYSQNYDLTGYWQTDDNKEITHFIRQINNEIYWYMSNPPSKYNVFHGTMVGNIITGKWIDLPGSVALNEGTLAMRIESNDRLVKLSDSGVKRYDVVVWTRNLEADDIATEKGAEPIGSRKKLLEEINVSSQNAQPVASKLILENGKNYIIEARGTFSCNSDMPACIDAAWCYAPRCTRNDPWGELMIDGMSFHTVAGTTVPYKDNHVYQINYRGKGKPVTLGIYDAVILNSYADNNGSLTVRIFQSK